MQCCCTILSYDTQLLDNDLAAHASSLVGLTVVAVLAGGGELGAHSLSWAIEVVFVREALSLGALLRHDGFEQMAVMSWIQANGEVNRALMTQAPFNPFQPSVGYNSPSDSQGAEPSNHAGPKKAGGSPLHVIMPPET